MQLTQKPWGTVVAELTKHLSECELSIKSLSQKANIDYFAARRALRNGVKSKSKAALSLCTFFGISLEFANTGSGANLNVREVLEQVLDGSQDQAELLAALIWSTKEFKITRDVNSKPQQGENDLNSGEE